MSEFISLREAARLLGRSYTCLLNYAREGWMPLMTCDEIPMVERDPRKKRYTRRQDLEKLRIHLQDTPGRRHSRQPLTWQIAANQDQIRWFAGLFDGEGCVHIAHRRTDGYGHSKALRIHVTNTAMQLMHHIPHLFGGRTYNRPKPSNNHRQQAVWRSTSRQASAILVAIEPYLEIKWRQAQIGIEFQMRVQRLQATRWEQVSQEERDWRYWAAAEISRLNHAEPDLRPR